MRKGGVGVVAVGLARDPGAGVAWAGAAWAAKEWMAVDPAGAERVS